MKRSSLNTEQGSVLITAFLTITILTLICATSLYVTSQNQNSGMQTASWQQALAGAEAGVDTAVRALNTGTWTGWNYQTYGSNTLPNTKPPYVFSSPSGTATPSSPYPTASGTPSSTQYNYYLLGSQGSPAISMTGVSGSTSPPEGNGGIWGWVTVDYGGLSADSNGQWYRVRATGVAGTNGLFRASNNRLDNDLRNTIGLRFDRKQLATISNPQATRTIEVIMQPIATGGWARAITLKNWISMSGNSVIDSFDSSNAFKSTNHLYDSAKRQSNAGVGTLNTGGNSSDLRSSYVYGSLAYSGSAPKNTSNVQGTISTPFNVTVPSQSAPTWTPTSTYTGGGSNPPNNGNFQAGNNSSPTYIKINGDLTTSSSGQPIRIQQHDNSAHNQIYIWVTGKLTTQGSGYIQQDSNVYVTWYVGNDITISGNSYINNSGYAAQNTIIGYGSNNKVTISSLTTDFIGTINAPNYDVTISGGGSLAGALIANTLTESGGSGLHYDEALGAGGANSTLGHYAFASWFEDNSDPTHKDVNGYTITY
jgi:hypothetical protein